MLNIGKEEMSICSWGYKLRCSATTISKLKPDYGNYCQSFNPEAIAHNYD
jgi:hypothetical protein